MKKIACSIACALMMLCCFAWGKGADNDKEMIVGAYLMGVRNELPDVNLVTHINYAFGHVNETFDGVLLPEGNGLSRVVGLKKVKPSLKVLLSIGGWGSGRFSEMASDPLKRKSFARDCARIVKESGLDGIDIDWEYPGSGLAGISSSPDDRTNFTLLMRDLRASLGKRSLLTIASVCNADYIDFKAVLPYLDYVNVMSYDMGTQHTHHAALYRSGYSGHCTADEAVRKHIDAGVPRQKIVMGMPFYGRGVEGYVPYRDGASSDMEFWDDTAKVPMILDSLGNMLFGYENARSIAEKCRYIVSSGLRGGMYWEYNADNATHDLTRAVYEGLRGSGPKKASSSVMGEVDNNGTRPANYAKSKRFKALMLWNPYAEIAHVQFDKQSMEFFHRLNYGDGFVLDTTTTLKTYTYEQLKEYSVIIALNESPSDYESRALFEKYMENGGGWIGFHASAYNDRNTRWPWYVKFLGCGEFKANNWPPQAALLEIDTHAHPVTKNLPDSYVAPPSEFYQWSSELRDNEDIQVLLTLSSKNYPMGVKDIVYGGDFPVVWTNKNYRMIYINMGHGDESYIDATQQLLFLNAFRWIVSRDPKGNPFDK